MRTLRLPRPLMRSLSLQALWSMLDKVPKPLRLRPRPAAEPSDSPVIRRVHKGSKLLRVRRAYRVMRGGLLVALAATVGAWGAAPSGPWDAFNLAPESKVVRPTAVKESHGSIQNGKALLTSSGRATFSANESWLTLDFGKEVCHSAYIDKRGLGSHVA